MNDKIKELAEQAGFKTNWQHADVQAIKMARFEKFVQLIVRECAEKCLDMKYVNPQPHHYAVMIKEHFGVKE